MVTEDPAMCTLGTVNRMQSITSEAPGLLTGGFVVVGVLALQPDHKDQDNERQQDAAFHWHHL